MGLVSGLETILYLNFKFLGGEKTIVPFFLLNLIFKMGFKT